MVNVSPASAVGVSAAWSVDSYATPSVFSEAQSAVCRGGLLAENFAEGEETCDTYSVTVTNSGGKPATGTVTVTGALGSGVSLAGEPAVLASVPGQLAAVLPAGTCVQEGAAKFACKIGLARGGVPFGTLMPPDGTLKVYVFVTVHQPEPVVTSVFSVEGGGAAAVHASVETPTGSVPASFGLSGFKAPFLSSEGLPEGQAGAHAYELATKIDLDSVYREDPEGFRRSTGAQDLRDVILDLPLGVVGSARSAPQCTLAQLSAKGEKLEPGGTDCPSDTVVGSIKSFPEGLISANGKIYNLVPERGVVAELGFSDTAHNPHVIYVSVAPTPAGYVLRSSTRELPQVVLGEVTANVYGDPAARARASEREAAYRPEPADSPMFTSPDDCTGEPLRSTLYIDSWQDPARFQPDGAPENLEEPAWAKKSFESEPVSGCEALEGLFAPEVRVSTETGGADEPTGLGLSFAIPQQEGESTLGTPPLKEALVTLPAGMSVNAASANGLEACSEAQVGWLGKSTIESGAYENFSEDVLNPENGESEATDCPKASRIGSVEVETPALPAEICKETGRVLSACPAASEREKPVLHGSIYLARQLENPFGSVLGAYVVVEDPRTGVTVKLPAKLEAGGQEGVEGLAAGQLRTLVADSPQFPFSELRVHIFGGEDASLRTPATCGVYSLTTALTPWSGPGAAPSSSFEVNQGAGGGTCPSPLGFAPALTTAGTASNQAGAFSPFALELARESDTQELQSLNVTLPPGLTGKIAGITLCPQAGIEQAEARRSPGEGTVELQHPSCPQASELGTATVGVGAGKKLFYTTARAYLAGPYNGAPFDLVVIAPAIAGPFDLGTVVVRNALYINPTTAQVTAKSQPFPTLLQGIPVDIRSIVLHVDHPGFTLNPTSCSALAVTAEGFSTAAQTASLSRPFYATGCTHLPFNPVLTATAAGQGSKANGTSFTVKITSPGIGQADIHKVDLTIPAKLPSRLTTINKACPAAIFEANPANCDEGSIIGEAIVHTPLLDNPLHGPGYLVSHGSAAFPDVEFVLQGENITILLDGKTDIKHGITYSRFETAPDNPFTTFEAILPAGPHSAFTPFVPEKENFSLCRQPAFTMATEITAQNGAQLKQNTPIELAGCPTKIALISHTLKHQTLTLKIYAPAAGKLRITSKHTHTTTKTTHHRETITIKLHLNNTHQHKTTIHLTFTPTTGHKQTTQLQISS